MKAGTSLDMALLRRRAAPWQKRWERQAQRIDALSLRERAILFLSIAAVLALLFDTLVLTPQSARAKQRAELQAQQSTELAQLRAQFVTASQEATAPAGQLQPRLDAALAERARLDGELRRIGAANGGDGLSAVLQRLLAQQPGLALERLTLLADAPVMAPATAPTVSLVALASAPASAPAAAAPPPPTTPAAPMAGMSWQGVELQVQGSYRDLQRYVQLLERELPGLRWGDMRVGAPGNGGPPRLQAQLFLLKVQP